ncbi:MAG: type II secretion system minor pseudopilin GspK [Sphingomonadaceae bacterium]|nr:type II secretion system minor pseudopilin GspK [Sphingomonadaceae bacterium]
MKRPIPPRERGAALLAVLLLVAVTGAIAAAAMEGLRLSRAVAANAAALDQARAFADGAEQLALLAIDDQIARSPGLTNLDGGWNGAVRQLTMPNDATVQLRVRDGGNCFNVNSVVEGEQQSALIRRPSGVAEFMGLMMAVGAGEADARRIAEAAADWVDTDSVPGPGGAEDEAYADAPQPYRTANNFFAEPGELRALVGMTPELYRRLSPYLCALPISDLAPINLNTLTPDQAPLLAMLAPGQLSLEKARGLIAGRPSGGWGSQVEFWRLDAMHGLAVPLDIQLQPQLRTRWFALDLSVRVGESEYDETALADARLQPSHIVWRRWSG